MVAKPLEDLREQLREGRDEARGIGEEIAGIAADLRRLAQAEVELARAEVGEQAGLAIRGAIWGGVTAFAGIIALVFVALTATFGLDEALPLWLSALIVTGVLLLVVGVAAYIAISAFRRLSVVPRRTIESLKGDVTWARSQMSSNGR